MSKTINLNDYFGDGLCPCGTATGYKNIGKGHWFYCEKCKVRRMMGVNLFDSWKHENEEIWRKNSDFFQKGGYK